MQNVTLRSASLTNPEDMPWTKRGKWPKCSDIFNLLKNMQLDFIFMVFVSNITHRKYKKWRRSSFPWMRLPYLLLLHVHRKWQWSFLWNRRGMGEVEIYRTGLCASKLHYSFLKVFFFFLLKFITFSWILFCARCFKFLLKWHTALQMDGTWNWRGISIFTPTKEIYKTW